MSDPTPMSAEKVETPCYCDIPCGEIIAYGVCKSSPTALPAMSEQPPAGDNVVLKLGHFDLCYKPCENCGYDAAKSGGENGKNRCWKCGRTIHQDFSARALKPEYANLAHLIKPPAVHGEVDITMQDVRLHVGEGCLTNADILKGCSIHMRRKSADKDALIRELYKALRAYRRLLSDGPENCTYEEYEDVDAIAKAALRQAEQGGGA